MAQLAFVVPQSLQTTLYIPIHIIGGGNTFKEHEILFSIIQLMIAYPFLHSKYPLRNEKKIDIEHKKIFVYMGTNEYASKIW